MPGNGLTASDTASSAWCAEPLVVDVARAPQTVVVVVVRDHHELVAARWADLLLQPAQVRRAPGHVIDQPQYVEVRAELVPQPRKGLLEVLQCAAGLAELVVDRHRSSRVREVNRHLVVTSIRDTAYSRL
jgi:hypothetical protein